MLKDKKKIIEALPVMAFMGYWLYSCLIGAVLSGDVRLMKIWFVSSPVIIASALSVLRIVRKQEADG